ncbi:RNA-directed DNA polymerase from mobile element jockey [Pseudolycoriella hygida]|uniref:RNA-directed DNA polymerase from mobile element jockey n=1 Tax=Pseudolycoriella hygida TaxID=35572 RepID=A0A9Q0MS33_9DIPT|nr:RNA-directed DNA polymerase from mobile element jockey [Pseudolycoriella hygida]
MPSAQVTPNKKYSDWFKSTNRNAVDDLPNDDLLPSELLTEMMLEIFQGPRACRTRLDQIQTVASVVLKGVAIAVNASLRHKNVPSPPTKVIESVAISVDTPGGEIVFISVYFPGLNVTSHVLDQYKKDIRLLTSIKAPYYICGDLNSRYRMWNNLSGNAAGFVLYQEMSRRPFNVLHSATPTYYPSQRDRNPSNIDIVLSNDLLAIEPVLTSGELMSDHRAIEFTIQVEHIDDNINRLVPLNSTEDINATIDHVTKVIRHAMDIAIPRKKSKPKFLRLNPEIIDLIKAKNRLSRKWQRTGDVNFLRSCSSMIKLIKKKIKILRNTNWSSKLKNLDFASKKFWQTTKLQKNKSFELPPLKGNDGMIAYTNQQKSEALASTFHKSHTLTLGFGAQRTEKLVASSILH